MVWRRILALIPIGRISGDYEMGLIIPFSSAVRKTARRTIVGPGKDADILFFTGVRYCRREATPAEGERPKNGRSRRGRRPAARRA